MSIVLHMYIIKDMLPGPSSQTSASVTQRGIVSSPEEASPWPPCSPHTQSLEERVLHTVMCISFRAEFISNK